MTLAFTPDDDFPEVADLLESVTVVRPGSSATTAVTHALCCGVKTREYQASEGAVAENDVAWHLPAVEMPTPPRPGDVILDARNQRWAVLTVRGNTANSRWRCVSRNLVLIHRLDQHVDIQKSTASTDELGTETLAWQTWKTGLAARIQPVAAEVTTVRQQQFTESRFRVFLVEDIAIDHTHRIKGPDGTLYRVLGFKRADRIDALMEIDVVPLD